MNTLVCPAAPAEEVTETTGAPVSAAMEVESDDVEEKPTVAEAEDAAAADAGSTNDAGGWWTQEE